MKFKFNDEQLSAILSAHEGKILTKTGMLTELWTGEPKCCIFQVAYGANFNQLIYNQFGFKDKRFYFEDSSRKWMNIQHQIWNAVYWFDLNYDPNWATETFLKKLTEQGLI